MGENRVPPYPSGDLYDWARRMYEFMVAQSPYKGTVEPQSVLLASKVTVPTGISARAAADGLMLYDPVNEAALISYDGVFHPMNAVPRALYAYSEAYNVNGAAISAGGDAVPLDTTIYNGAPWVSFNAATGEFTLTEGQYYITGDVAIASNAAGDHSAFVHIAENTDLTTPVGNVISNTAHLASGQSNLNIPVPFAGELTVASGGKTYNLVVRSASSNLQFGNAHGVVGFDNYYARLSIAKIGI